MTEALIWLLAASVVFVVAGLATYAVGDSSMAVAEQRMINASGATWGEILDYETTASDRSQLRRAELDVANANSQMSTGRLLMIVGAVGAVATGVAAMSGNRRASSTAIIDEVEPDMRGDRYGTGGRE